ncbi:Alpha-methylacyl-CoA racemase [Plesiocystis pacifica SIR-1]|uniref:Alpha-methylacyl-CoA racemase n=1 Tax=Plesiocystis pacifica SIR-1 TaxID=391625 RepID=A6G042_9BACT|nr:CaiB/BaiF CoA-transferase family protein [Plesiocystis pacifica]EDM80739.1 Alpha-methylacyl-CoA racemase [Plesiocystis pacifica SIR-1]
MSAAAPPPLDGLLVVDCTRLVPGAVLARTLLDLGARLIKIEAPRGGDLMRTAPPLVGGVGVGYCVYFRGAESLRLDLRDPLGMARLTKLLQRADVFMESFRPGTLARWGLDLDAVEASNPGLVSCTLPAIADDDKRVAHDLNLTGLTGFLGQLPGNLLTHGSGADIPRMLIADVTTGLLAGSSILAALVGRGATGRGRRVSQSLLSAPLPFLTWPWADQAAGVGSMGGMFENVLAGRVACYRCYRCADGKLISVGCLEPKFWVSLCQLLEQPELAAAGLDLGARGQAAADATAERFATKPVDAWMALLAPANLPVAPVHDLDAARSEALIASAGLLEHTPMPGGGQLSVPGPALPSVSKTPSRPAPSLGEHDQAIIAEFGL